MVLPLESNTVDIYDHDNPDVSLWLGLGVDADAARGEEEDTMMRDANQWLNNDRFEEQPHPKTGATALHVAAAKGYIQVMQWVLAYIPTLSQQFV